MSSLRKYNLVLSSVWMLIVTNFFPLSTLANRLEIEFSYFYRSPSYTLLNCSYPNSDLHPSFSPFIFFIIPIHHLTFCVCCTLHTLNMSTQQAETWHTLFYFITLPPRPLPSHSKFTMPQPTYMADVSSLPSFPKRTIKFKPFPSIYINPFQRKQM